VVAGGRFTFEEGAVVVPTEPGLGVELDRVALAKLHENLKKCGLTHRDDQIEMQKIEPGWRFQATRW
jgi:glucarate dehydratase